MINIYKNFNLGILFVYWIIIVLISIKIIMKRRAVSTTIVWLLTMYIVPALGISIYLLFGELQLDQLRKKRSKNTWSLSIKNLYNIKNFTSDNYKIKNSEVASSLFKFCEKRQGMVSGITGNNIQLLSNAENIMHKLIKDIKMAKNNIEIIFYIWFPGGMADEVAMSLIEASRRGVHCRLMLDSAGSVDFFRSSWVNTMCKAGIEIVEALKISLLYIFVRRMDLRQHRKIILIDNYIAYTGSMNLIDPHYFKKNMGIGEWIDLMARIKGPMVNTLRIIFTCDWAMETGKYVSQIPPIYNASTVEKQDDCQCIRAIASGPSFPKNIIHQSLLTAIYSAKKKLIITTPYFVPSDDLLLAICTASYRGVDVSLIVPMYNDSTFVSWASKAFFDELLESGVKIYQFYRGLLHTKSLLIDDQLSMIGTVNFDMRSLWINFELILFIDSTTFSNNLALIQGEYIANSKLLDANTWSKRTWKKKVFEKIFYFFSPLL